MRHSRVTASRVGSASLRGVLLFVSFCALKLSVQKRQSAKIPPTFNWDPCSPVSTGFFAPQRQLSVGSVFPSVIWELCFVESKIKISPKHQLGYLFPSVIWGLGSLFISFTYSATVNWGLGSLMSTGVSVVQCQLGSPFPGVNWGRSSPVSAEIFVSHCQLWVFVPQSYS